MSLYRLFAKASKPASDVPNPSGPLSASISPATIKEASVAIALPYTARKCENYQLRMRTISSRRHTKLKNTKFYSKGVLVNHTKISTNENFPLYGKLSTIRNLEYSDNEIPSCYINEVHWRLTGSRVIQYMQRSRGA